jgi:hypothetical protein
MISQTVFRRTQDTENLSSRIGSTGISFPTPLEFSLDGAVV